MIYNCDNNKLGIQHEYLKKVLNNDDVKTYDDKFIVFNHECGTGKSRTVEEFFGTLIGNGDNEYKYLFVKERNVDGVESAKRINKLAKKNIAIAVNTDTHNTKTFNKLKEHLKEWKIVIISHEKYKALSKNKSERKYFESERDVLVVDEFINMTNSKEVLSISKEKIEAFENLLGKRALRNLYVECIAELEDYLIKEKELKTFFNAKTDFKTINSKINKLKSLIKTNLTKEYLEQIGYTKQGLCKKMDEIKQFYNQTCIVEGSYMYCTDRTCHYWFLPKNNIMLDASAELNMAYRISDKFVINRQSKVLDHKEWKFYIMKTNSSKGAKEKAIDFYSTINNMVKLQGEDEILVIGNKNDEDFIEAKYKNHIGNITGSNAYKDLTKIILAHNPNTVYRQYILDYIYYSEKKFDNRNTWTGVRNGSKAESVYRFKEEKFEEYRQCKNANELYQAIKRINRSMKYEAKVMIFNNDMETINRVLKMFKGIDSNVKEYDNLITFEKNGMDRYNEERAENRQAKKFIKLLDSIKKLEYIDYQAEKKNRKGEMIQQQGIYKKQTLRELMGIENKAQFNNNILKDLDVIDYIKRHNIIVGGQTLDFTKFV